jgi:hypothetical protein
MLLCGVVVADLSVTVQQFMVEALAQVMGLFHLKVASHINLLLVVADLV